MLLGVGAVGELKMSPAKKLLVSLGVLVCLSAVIAVAVGTFASFDPVVTDPGAIAWAVFVCASALSLVGCSFIGAVVLIGTMLEDK